MKSKYAKKLYYNIYTDTPVDTINTKKINIKKAIFILNSAWNDIKPSSIIKSLEPIELLPNFEINLDDITFENSYVKFVQYEAYTDEDIVRIVNNNE
ncbi:hypothetical protein A3Q56_04037 [Intoshia linei]|uniref:DDE-1 domain-containing protein n=1 Tax=Intoshia linei TaxID=1819745 RepID=A0A177B1W3_9BILA|nr:hypothetical protein A3Q56_04037 [Intoshia linei]